MSQRDIRSFEPKEFAHLDTEMWKAYYKHNFLKLFVLLFRLSYIYCRPNVLLTIRVAYHSAKAAIVFRKTKYNEDLELVEKHLQQFYKLLSDNNVNQFDYTKAARLELQWWMIDRYPDRYETTRATTLSETMAVIYNIDPTDITIYGQKREAAMLLLGRHHYDKKVVPDWNNIELLLISAYENLHSAIHKPTN